jgi:hypothetical protein
MLAFFCGKCQALDEKGVQGHRCGVAPVTTAPVKQTAAERAKANNKAYAAKQRKLAKDRKRGS